MHANTVVKQVKNIFSLPEVVMKINEILNSHEFNIAELEAVVLHDPGLTIKLLKLVNSSYFGFPTKIDTVSRAISMIGLQEFSNLVMGTAITDQFENISSDLVDMNTFWYHSVIKGVLTKILAKQCQADNYQRFYIAGLLSGIGKLVLFNLYSAEMAQILSLPDQSDSAILTAEKTSFGFDHAELGAELLKEWKLPTEIWQMVYFQFDPLNEQAPKKDASLLNAAGKIANTIQPCRNQSFDINTQKPEIDEQILEFLQLSADDIQTSVSEALLYPWEILSVIFPAAMTIY